MESPETVGGRRGRSAASASAPAEVTPASKNSVKLGKKKKQKQKKTGFRFRRGDRYRLEGGPVTDTLIEFQGRHFTRSDTPAAKCQFLDVLKNGATPAHERNSE